MAVGGIGGRRPRRGGSPGLRWFLGVLAVLAAVWVGGLIAFAEGIPLAVDDEISPTDAIVVLTGGSKRLETGIELLRAGKAERLFVSGVYQGLEVRQLLDSVAVGSGGLSGRIEIGNAVSTIGNADETAAWVRTNDVGSIRLVTGAYHMPRSLLEFRATLPEVRIVPHPVFPEHVKQEDWWMWPGTAGLTVDEYNKFLAAWARLRAEDAILALADWLRALQGDGEQTRGTGKQGKGTA